MSKINKIKLSSLTVLSDNNLPSTSRIVDENETEGNGSEDDCDDDDGDSGSVNSRDKNETLDSSDELFKDRKISRKKRLKTDETVLFKSKNNSSCKTKVFFYKKEKNCDSVDRPYNNDNDNDDCNEEASVVDSNAQVFSQEDTFNLDHLLNSNKCPLCLKIDDKIVSHIKSCYVKKKLSPQQLFDVLKLQWKQDKEREAIGLPIVPEKVAPKKKSSKRKLPTAGEGSSIDLALALSMSLKEAQDKAIEEANLLISGLQEETGRALSNLHQFGFEYSGKKTTGGKPLTLLQTRIKEDRERIVTEKVAMVLMDEDDHFEIDDHKFIASSTPKSTKLRKHYHKQCDLWNLASAPEVSSKDFYVESLANVITPSLTEPGRLLQHVSQIPGRMKTPPHEIEGNVSVEENNVTVLNGNSLIENNEIKTKINGNIKKSDIKCFPRIKSKLHKNSLISAWKSFYGKNYNSDVTVITHDNHQIPVHSVVLHVRCQNILNSINVNHMDNINTRYVILWEDILYDAANIFLKYIYCAEFKNIFSYSKRIITDVLHLIERYNVKDLEDFFKTINLKAHVKDMNDLAVGDIHDDSSININDNSNNKNVKRDLLNRSHIFSNSSVECKGKLLRTNCTFSRHNDDSNFNLNNICTDNNKVKPQHSDLHNDVKRELNFERKDDGITSYPSCSYEISNENGHIFSNIESTKNNSGSYSYKIETDFNNEINVLNNDGGHVKVEKECDKNFELKLKLENMNEDDVCDSDSTMLVPSPENIRMCQRFCIIKSSKESLIETKYYDSDDEMAFHKITNSPTFNKNYNDNLNDIVSLSEDYNKIPDDSKKYNANSYSINNINSPVMHSLPISLNDTVTNKKSDTGIEEFNVFKDNKLKMNKHRNGVIVYNENNLHLPSTSSTFTNVENVLDDNDLHYEKYNNSNYKRAIEFRNNSLALTQGYFDDINRPSCSRNSILSPYMFDDDLLANSNNNNDINVINENSNDFNDQNLNLFGKRKMLLKYSSNNKRKHSSNFDKLYDDNNCFGFKKIKSLRKRKNNYGSIKNFYKSHNISVSDDESDCSKLSQKRVNDLKNSSFSKSNTDTNYNNNLSISDPDYFKNSFEINDNLKTEKVIIDPIWNGYEDIQNDFESYNNNTVFTEVQNNVSKNSSNTNNNIDFSVLGSYSNENSTNEKKTEQCIDISVSSPESIICLSPVDKKTPEVVLSEDDKSEDDKSEIVIINSFVNNKKPRSKSSLLNSELDVFNEISLTESQSNSKGYSDISRINSNVSNNDRGNNNMKPLNLSKDKIEENKLSVEKSKNITEKFEDAWEVILQRCNEKLRLSKELNNNKSFNDNQPGPSTSSKFISNNSGPSTSNGFVDNKSELSTSKLIDDEPHQLPASNNDEFDDNEPIVSILSNFLDTELKPSYFGKFINDETRLSSVEETKAPVKEPAVSVFTENVNDTDKNSFDVNVLPSRNNLKQSSLLESSSPCAFDHVCIITRMNESPPDYYKMNDNELKKQLGKYGLKQSLGVEHARKILTFIYDKLHPALSKDNINDHIELKSVAESFCDVSFLNKTPEKKTNQNENDRFIEEMVIDDNISDDDSSSNNSEIIEEIDIEENSDDSSPITNNGTLQDSIRDYIKSNKELYMNVLLYKVVQLKDIVEGLKSRGVKFKISELMEGLDSEGVIYQGNKCYNLRKRKLSRVQLPEKVIKRKLKDVSASTVVKNIASKGKKTEAAISANINVGKG
ncbi:uncharacterized protein LOC142330182 isoform X3 [Lycorma delicatula]|uniref:uncharacterized protein LOC142330182 isoform X3 n=1 Tax=Lycorma delicatula TaxID=130591 RepID=UPI003F51479F